MPARIVEQTSDVAAPIDRVWARVVSPEGINDEMRPWMTMSMPRGADDLTIDTIERGVRLGRAWQHERSLTPVTDGVTRVHDRVTFEPRWFMRLSAVLLRRILAAFFAHRHRRLARHYRLRALSL